MRAQETPHIARIKKGIAKSMPTSRMLAVYLISACVAQAASTVSGITFDGIGDSSARVLFDASSTFNLYRVRYGTAPCSGGSGGRVQTNGGYAPYFSLFSQTGQLSGLAPSTTYFVCPEVSDDGGSSWSSGVQATFTTLSRTTTAPIAPTSVSTTFPEPTGTPVTVSGATDCSDATTGLQARINAAEASRYSTGMGVKITVPVGYTCIQDLTTPLAPEAISFSPSDVAPSTSTLTLTAHPFTENQEVHFSTAGANSNCLPGMKIWSPTAQTFATCATGGGWNTNTRYWVHVVDANHVQILSSSGGSPAIPSSLPFTADAAADTIYIKPSAAHFPGGFYTASGYTIPINTTFQFATTGTLPAGLSPNTTYYVKSACTSTSLSVACTFQVSLSSGGAAVNITDAGTGTHYITDPGLGTMYIAPAPAQTDQWNVITSSGTCPARGTRVTSSDDAQLFGIRKSNYSATDSFRPGILAHNWRIECAKFDSITNTDYLTSIDPRRVCVGFSTGADNRFISMDHVRIVGPGYPNNIGCKSSGTGMYWDGGYVSVIDADIQNLDIWHAWFGGTSSAGFGTALAPTLASGTQVTFTAGRANLGVVTTTTTGTTTINFTGGAATGTCYVYVAMDGTFKVVCPTGTTGNCSITGSIAPSGTLTCTVSATASPAFPMTGGGSGDRASGLPIFTITLTAGTATAVTPSYFEYYSDGAYEGPNGIIGGYGPGPYLLQNTYLKGTGIILHFDDSGGPNLSRGDMTIKNNYFQTNQIGLVWNFTGTPGPSANGLWYANRQPLEWKSGQRLLVEANTFAGNYGQGPNPNGMSLVLTPRSGGYVTDVDIKNNQFLNVNGCIHGASPVDTYNPISKPAARQRITNNLCLIDAYAQTVAGSAQPYGFAFLGGAATENVEYSHNTVYFSKGSSPEFLRWQRNPVGGLVVTDNIYAYSNATAFIAESIDGCSSVDYAFLQCAATSGPGTPSYSFLRNLVIPSWATSQTETGLVSRATIINSFGGSAGAGGLLDNTTNQVVPSGVSVAANMVP